MTGSLPRGLLLLGATGRLGRPLLAAARQQWLVEAPGRGELDLRTATESELGRLIERSGVEAVLNAAALAGVDACERSRSEAMVVNGEAPGRLARACRSAGVPLVQVSTDYVFGGDGEQAPYAEDASPAPVQHYGRSKARGEREVLDSGAAASVVRVSCVCT